MSRFSIDSSFQNFMSHMTRETHSSKYRYEISFSFGTAFLAFLSQFSTELFLKNIEDIENMGRFKCIEAVFPPRIFSTIDYRYNGPIRKQPFNIQFDDVSFTILSTEKHIERKIFEYYFQFAYDKKYNMRYNDDVKCSIKVFQINEKGTEKTLEIELMDCMPVSLEAMTLSYSAATEPQSFQVRFNFRDYQTMEINY